MTTDARARLADLYSRADEGQIRTWRDLQQWREESLGLLRTLLPNDHERLDQFARHPTHTTYRRNLQYSLPGVPSEEQELVRKTEHLGSLLRGMLVEIDTRVSEPPQLAFADLHPPIVAAATELWNGEHFRQAVDEGARAVELQLRAKLGREDLAGYMLVTEAFNPALPKAGEGRLRFSGFTDGTPSWTDAHRGAMHFAQGCMLRIRNLFEHHDEEPSRQVALESLAALSLLSRWIEEARVVRGTE